MIQFFTAGVSGCFEGAVVIESESESDITKQLKLLSKNPKIDPILSPRSADAFQLKQGTQEYLFI